MSYVSAMEEGQETGRGRGEEGRGLPRKIQIDSGRASNLLN